MDGKEPPLALIKKKSPLVSPHSTDLTRGIWLDSECMWKEQINCALQAAILSCILHNIRVNIVKAHSKYVMLRYINEYIVINM